MELNGRAKLLIYGPEMRNVVCDPVTPDDFDSLFKLKSQMLEIMQRCGGAGLAAPQIGIFKQFVIVQLEDESVLELVNPDITRMYGKELEDYESCLSIPPAGNGCKVPRLEFIDIEAASIEFPYIKRPYKFKLTSARVVQHELDHLTGTFFIDRVAEKKKRVVIEEFEFWKKQWEKDGRPFPFGGNNHATGPRSAYRSERYLSQVRFRS